MPKFVVHTEDFTAELYYRGKKFVRLELKRGTLLPKHLQGAPNWIPLRADQVPAYRQRYPALGYEEVQAQKSLYKEYVEAWYSFYEGWTGIKPRFAGKEGKALKGIKSYLEEISGSPEEALATWQGLLKKWHHLDEFYRKSPDVAFINSQINKILNQLQDVTSAKKGPDGAGLRGRL